MAIEQMPVKESSGKKMWALRLSERHRTMLQESAALSNRNKTEFLEWLIERYYDDVVKRVPKRKSA